MSRENDFLVIRNITLIEIALSHCNILQRFSYPSFLRSIILMSFSRGTSNGPAESSFYRARNDNDKLVIIAPIPRDVLAGEHALGEDRIARELARNTLKTRCNFYQRAARGNYVRTSPRANPRRKQSVRTLIVTATLVNQLNSPGRVNDRVFLRCRFEREGGEIPTPIILNGFLFFFTLRRVFFYVVVYKRKRTIWRRH